MALQRVRGIHSHWFPGWLNGWTSAPTTAEVTMDAAGEGCYFIGRCLLEAGTGSKIISSAGGKIHWLVGASAVLNNGSTNLRVGIQDVAGSGGPPPRGDGAFDVFDDLTSADTLTSATQHTTVMSSGTKTINHGDMIAVAWDMTARGGADSVRVRFASASVSMLRPNVVGVTSGPTYTSQNGVPTCVIEFDDGTLGFVEGGWNTSTGAIVTATNFNSGSTPDEYCLIFTPAVPLSVDAIRALLACSAGADFEVVLYSDPEGTPAVIETISVPVAQVGATAITREFKDGLSQWRDLSAGAKYGVAIRPTTTNNVTIFRYAVSATAHWKGHWNGDACYLGSRTNQSGAFTPITTERMFVGLRGARLEHGARPRFVMGGMP